MCLLAVSKSKAKKTPLGERGVRVIVVVANLVSVQRIGLWWIVVVVVTGLLIIVMCSFSCLIRYFWLRCLIQISKSPCVTETFFVRNNI